MISLCPTMENADLVLQEKGSSLTHSRFNHVPSVDTLHRDAMSNFHIYDCYYIRNCVLNLSNL